MVRIVKIKEIEGLRSLRTKRIPKKYEVITYEDNKIKYRETVTSKIKAENTRESLLKRFKRMGL